MFRIPARLPCRACPTTRRRATPAAQERPARGKYWWLRWVIIGVAVVVLAVELALVWDQLAKAWKSLYSANWWWVLAAVVAAMASMHSFAQIQRTLLRSAGVHGPAVAFGGGVLRRQRADHHAARRPGAVGHVHLPPTTDLGRVTGGGVVAAGDVGCAAGDRPGAARSGRRLPARREATTRCR